MLRVCALAGRRDRTNSNSVRDTKIDVKRLLIRPTNSVVANPRMGPVPNWKRNAAAMSDVTCVSKSVQKTRSKLAGHGGPGAAVRRQLLFDALENQHVRVDAHAHRQDEAGDARQRHRRAEVGHHPEQDDQVDDHRENRVDARQLVVGEHEEHDQDEAGERRADARADRIGAKRRTDHALLEVGHRGRQRARAQLQREVRRLLLVEAAGDSPFGADPRLNPRVRLHPVVEHDGEVPARRSTR